MPTPASGTITIYDINKEFALGNDIAVYRGVRWYTPASLETGLFSTTNLSFADFYNKQAKDPAQPSPTGGVPYVTPGTYDFIVPLFRTSLTVKLWGGGGGGGGYGNYPGSSYSSGVVYGANGADTIFAAPVKLIAGGGKGGQNAGRDRYGGLASGAGGAGGTAVGGDVNTPGFAGGNGYTGYNNCHGGGSPNGGADTPNNAAGINGYGYPGNAPGGGGGGVIGDRGAKFWANSGGAGGGGYVQKTYTTAELVSGTIIKITIGAGGLGNKYNGSGGDGANGKILITWS